MTVEAEVLERPYPRELCLAIVGAEGKHTAVCELCHYVGQPQEARSQAKAALVQHRMAVSHRRNLRRAA